jgi:ubiquinone/menaquinone biosynthesis C-methylase UbiE
MAELKQDIQVINRKGLYYIKGRDNRIIKYTPWLGDIFSFAYDAIMQNSVIPRKLGVDIEKHTIILAEELFGMHGRQVLELATGTGCAVQFLPSDNHYTGTDISPGLLKRAMTRFQTAGFPEPEFYVVRAEDVPFANGAFDLCLCILALNFFSSARKALQEAWRVLVPGGLFICSVPVPERNKLLSTIRGSLHTEAELEQMCQNCGFSFEPVPVHNGTLLYFKATKT